MLYRICWSFFRHYNKRNDFSDNSVRLDFSSLTLYCFMCFAPLSSTIVSQRGEHSSHVSVLSRIRNSDARVPRSLSSNLYSIGRSIRRTKMPLSTSSIVQASAEKNSHREGLEIRRMPRATSLPLLSHPSVLDAYTYGNNARSNRRSATSS